MAAALALAGSKIACITWNERLRGAAPPLCSSRPFPWSIIGNVRRSGNLQMSNADVCFDAATLMWHGESEIAVRLPLLKTKLCSCWRQALPFGASSLQFVSQTI